MVGYLLVIGVKTAKPDERILRSRRQENGRHSAVANRREVEPLTYRSPVRGEQRDDRLTVPGVARQTTPRCLQQADRRC